MTHAKRFMWNILHTLNLLTFTAVAFGQQLPSVMPASTSCTPSAPVVAIVVAFVLLVAAIVYFVIVRHKSGAQFGEAFMQDLARRVAQNIVDAPVKVEPVNEVLTFDGRTFRTQADLDLYRQLKQQLEAIPKE